MTLLPELTSVAQGVCATEGYVFVGKVGEGAFKETFHVMDQSGLSLALKVYKPHAREERTEREIQAMQTCNHPGVARIFSLKKFFIEPLYFVYTTEEYFAGGTLTTRLHSEMLLKPPAIFVLGQQLINAVAHIASHDFVHRDLKPDNIMFREDGQTAVVVDFGLVRQLDAESLTVTWAMQGPGTPYYAAPEQLNNDKELIDWRTDQFSLGVVLAFCAFGQHPYDEGEGDALAAIDRVVRRARPSGEFLSRIQAAGLPVLAKMVAPWPVERYRTPQDLISAWNSQEVG